MIETTITKIQYDADGVQRRWSIPFQYADAKHISIYTKVGEEPTVKVVDNYDIDEDDSVVIYPTVASGQEPLSAGTKIIIARETPETQLEDASQVHFTSKDVERGLDKLTMITQELSTTAGETMGVSADAFEAAEEAVSTANEANATANEAKTLAGQAVSVANDANATATTANTKSDTAIKTANDANEKSTAAVSTANAAKTVAGEANSIANKANATAMEAKEIATAANATANNAEKTANEADKKADNAVIVANNAKSIAEGIDGKATQALANSTTALEKATEAKNTADSYQGQITTIRNDVDSLSEQVSVINAKIPQAASDSNQLVDKASMTSAIAAVQKGIDDNAGDITALQADLAGKQDKGDYATNAALTTGLNQKADKANSLSGYGITDAFTKEEVNAELGKKADKATTYSKTEVDNAINSLQMIKWVDSLPETGESKYIYAVPREEVDKDGKKSAALYLWDGSAWRGAGAFSLNIDPDTLATKTELAGYLPLSSKAVANGVASLDANARVPVAQIPDLSSTYATINSLATVATSGSYNDLTNKPTIPTVDSALSSTSTNAIQNKVVNTALAGKANATHTHASGDITGLATVAISGMYSDLTGTPGAATTDTLGLVKPDGNTITVTADGVISATGGSGSGSGFDFEGTKAEFDAAVAAGTITADSVSLITDDVSGDNVATKAELQAVDRSKADTTLSNVLANIDYVVESKFPTADDPTWYRKYKSGWLEQGGIISPSSAWGTINLLKPYVNTQYIVLAAVINGNTDVGVTIKDKTISSFAIYQNVPQNWEAKGMGAN